MTHTSTAPARSRFRDAGLGLGGHGCRGFSKIGRHPGRNGRSSRASFGLPQDEGIVPDVTRSPNVLDLPWARQRVERLCTLGTLPPPPSPVGTRPRMTGPEPRSWPRPAGWEAIPGSKRRTSAESAQARSSRRVAPPSPWRSPGLAPIQLLACGPPRSAFGRSARDDPRESPDRCRIP